MAMAACPENEVKAFWVEAGLPPNPGQSKIGLDQLGPAPRFARRFSFAEKPFTGRSARKGRQPGWCTAARVKGKPRWRAAAMAALDPVRGKDLRW
ncbi:hypothetical protein AN476_06860 [Phaeobacter sp. 11ANDIMAR09]|nr:hypothetical protein AN476_06860 [Phaeobacter sp. 11ANDIMAR09]